MDSKDRTIIQNQCKNWIPAVTEEMLLALANKGTVNRGKKDLEKYQEQITVSINAALEAVVVIPDEAEITMRDPLPACTCSCPSMNLCRHLVTAVFYLQTCLKEDAGSSLCSPVHLPGAHPLVRNDAVTGKPDEAEAVYQKEAFTELNALKKEELQKLIGKKEWTKLLKTVQREKEAVFTYGTMLQIAIGRNVFPDGAVHVFFPVTASIQNAVCSCRDINFCCHKAYALLAYQIYECEREELIGEAVPEEKVLVLQEGQIQLVLQIKERMAGYLEKGIAGLTEEAVRYAEQDYIRAYGFQMFYLAEELKQLANYLAGYFSKSAGYQNQKTMHVICKIYNRLEAILHSMENTMTARQFELLIGKRKEESKQYAMLHLTGLGIKFRLTLRRDLLASAFFYAKECREIVTLSTLRPVPEEGQLLKNVHFLSDAGLFWEGGLSFHKIYASNIQLCNAVVTEQKLSGRKTSRCVMEGSTSREDFEEIAIHTFSELNTAMKAYSYQYFALRQGEGKTALLRIQDMGSCVYDTIKQALLFPVYDKTGSEILLYVPYSKVSEPEIKYMEQHKKLAFDYVLGNFQIKNGTISGEFLSGITNGKVWDFYDK